MTREVLRYFGGPRDGEPVTGTGLISDRLAVKPIFPPDEGRFHHYVRGKAPWSPPGQVIEAMIYQGQR